MTHQPFPRVRLTRCDLARNMRRFYALSLEPNLFGETTLVRNWGRIGTSGQSRLHTFDDPAEAALAFEEWRSLKARKGYVPETDPRLGGPAA